MPTAGWSAPKATEGRLEDDEFAAVLRLYVVVTFGIKIYIP
jgi:hypothetical protein